MVSYAWCVVFVHSHFTENPPIDLDVTNPSFLSWFCPSLKPRIFDRLKPYARKWMKELSLVLWALHTTLSQAT
jgi:hypothetical protein